MKSVVEGSGRIEPIIRVLREDFTTIYPRPALFSPLNGCMTGAVNVEKVKAMLNTSVDWLDPVYANLVNATTSNNSGSYFSNSGSGKSASSSTGPLIKRSPSSGGGWGFNRRSRASSDESNNRPEIQAQPQIPSRPVSVATPSVSENSARRRSRTIFGGDHQPNSKTVGSLKPGSNSSVVSAPVSPSVKVFGPSSASDLPSGHSISQSIAANSTASSLASDASSNAPPSSNLYQFAAAAAVTAGAGNGGAVMISSSSSSSSSSALASGVITSPITPTKKSYILYHTESNPNSIDVHAYLQLYLPQTYDLIVREQPTEKELRMLSHCIDEQELNEWAAMGYISRNDMKGALHHGKMDPIINMLKQDFSIIYPYPALFSPFNGTMTGAISLEKVRALLSTSLDGADPSYADSKRRNTDAGIISTSSSVSSVKESGVGAGGGVKKSKSSSSSSAKSLVASSHQIPQALITSSNILKNSKSQVALPSCDEITGVFWISPPSITDNHSSPAPISSKATPIISSDIASPFLLSPTQIRKTNNQQQNLQQQPTPPRKPALQTTYLRVDEDLKFRARAISGKKTLSSPDLFTPTPAEKSSATKVATTSPTIDSPIYVTTTVRTGPTRKTTSTKKSSSRHSFSEVQQPAKIRQFLLFHDPNSIVSVAILRHLQDNLSKVYTGYELVIEENFPTEKVGEREDEERK